MHAQAGAGEHDEAVAGQVFAEVRVLEGRGAQAGCINDHRKRPGLGARIFDGFGHLNALAFVVLANVAGLKQGLQLDGALLCAQGREVVLGRHEVEIAADEHRLGTRDRLRGIPDQCLDGAGPLSCDQIAFCVDALVGACVVVLLHHPKAHRMRPIGHRECEVRLLNRGGRRGAQQHHSQDLGPRHLFHPAD